MELNDLLHAAADSRASDILLVSGAPPILRVDGDLRRTALDSLTPSSVEGMVYGRLSEAQAKLLRETGDLDYSLDVPRLGRFRFNAHRQRDTYAAAIRFIPNRIPTLEDLRLPKVIEYLTRLHQGLVLVTGQTGSGKSTTLAAMIERINQTMPLHVVTLEDPIEFVFSHGQAIVEQREVGADCTSFASALRHVVRQDPDIIFVGELRDLETISTAISAAETGHLVFGTLHTTSAASTVDRLIDVFPAAQQPQIRAQLSESLRAVVSQRLLRRAGGSGRLAAVEVMMVTHAIQRCIRDQENHLIPGIIQTGRKFGMQSMEQALSELHMAGLIDSNAIVEQGDLSEILEAYQADLQAARQN
ncbi:MAG: PilT/PilU family type 4a pilus ATPase [Planctomycetes bacterium]|nr:PilT/PilU family type 4a pilus ATPase [Planctomycetota bacterium]